ncbi:MAG: ADP-forming succinate--CoA ligase subunit beta [Ectothiorhodospiraceae bacterium]|nr:ADP-forming succinate--CoA ligase subunit beta [Chromatiales bacterium]MCP5157156.1 ADP-forming succinate--CoA ligase subunit beta [Ectothiorhodospiraceae bacterium]
MLCSSVAPAGGTAVDAARAVSSPRSATERARMNLHEYQSKGLLAEYGVPVPRGEAARTPDEARAKAASLGGDAWMVKAQVHAGGRGKAGGVKKAGSLDDVAKLAGEMLGRRLVTKQTTAEGQPINEVLVETTTSIGRELYLSLLVDRARRQVAIMASAAGGMDIEEVAATEPEKIVTEFVDPAAGLQPYQCRRIGFALGLDGAQRKSMAQILTALYRLFCERDLSMLELNPLVVTGDGALLALDAKVNLDDNALYRHPELEKLADHSQEDEKEVKAKQFDLNYVTLDGNIACMVNGAGLAMGTMDIIKLHGGEPANFLDVGGGTDATKVAEAFKLIVSDAKVQAILVNIFGGIVRCDLIAEGIIKAVQEVGVTVPVVVRLEGTNVERGRELLAGSGLAVIAAESLEDAARKVVAAAAG